MQENATREELLREIDALKQENADLKTQIEQLTHDKGIARYLSNRANNRAKGFEEELNNLKDLVESYRRIVNELLDIPKKDGLCQCGCGKPLNQEKKGRRKKFYSDACRVRYNRRNKTIIQAEKKYKKRKLRPIMSDKE